jgi:two-component system, OmpR family, response regulator
MTRILSIDDDEEILEEIFTSLASSGHEVEVATTGRAGLVKVMAQHYDVVTLDRLLPDLDGLSVLAAMRGFGIDTPVLLLSGMASVDERVRGLRAGGDDYLAKPFLAEEVAARVDVLCRRGSRREAAPTVLQVGRIELDMIGRTARVGMEPVELLPTEIRILEYLMRRHSQVVTRTMVFEAVWGYRFDPGTNLIDVHVSRLRAKLSAAGAGRVVRTIRGSGYMLVA